MPLCIGIDCDDVLSQTMSEIIKRSPLKEKGIKMSDITSYKLSEVEKVGLNLEETVQLFYDFFDSPEYMQANPVPGAYEKLYERKKKGHKLFVVTGRPPRYENITREWVEKYFPGFFSDFLFMSQYTENEIPKSQLCLEKGIQVLIDDSASNIYDMNAVGMPGFLLDSLRNQGVENSELLHRVYSRDEIDLGRFFNF